MQIPWSFQRMMPGGGGLCHRFAFSLLTPPAQRRTVQSVHAACANPQGRTPMSEPNEYMTPPPPPPPSASPSAEERQWAMFAHLSALLGGLLTGAVGGWGSFLGPLIIWLIKKDTMPFVDDQAKEALNFNITVSAVFLLLWILTFITLFIGAIVTFPLMFIIGIAALVFIVIAAIKSNEGTAYRYPFTLRLVK
jgi:uncharacterized protein